MSFDGNFGKHGPKQRAVLSPDEMLLQLLQGPRALPVGAHNNTGAWAVGPTAYQVAKHMALVWHDFFLSGRRICFIVSSEYDDFF